MDNAVPVLSPVFFMQKYSNIVTMSLSRAAGSKKLSRRGSSNEKSPGARGGSGTRFAEVNRDEAKAFQFALFCAIPITCQDHPPVSDPAAVPLSGAAEIPYNRIPCRS